MTRPWDDLLSEQDRAVISAAGYGTRGAATIESRELGRRPALLVIDMQHLFVGEDVPIQEAIRQQPTMIGAAGWRAVEQMQPLLAVCREAAVPVVYLRMIPKHYSSDDPLLDIIEAVRPADGERVIAKCMPSAFFQTGLADDLRGCEVDTVILVGNSTSGCILAAAVDAVQHGFSVLVPQECVFDRIEASHKIGLLDLWMKIARVETVNWTMDYLRDLDALSRARQHESSEAGAP
jgi:maleamate amidohydrolase